MEVNLFAIIVAAFIPMIMGFAWYHPKTFGTKWMQSLGKTEKELMEGFNMPLVMGVALVLSFLLAFAIDAFTEMTHKDVVDGVLVYGSHHTFGHGALHGGMMGVLIGLPILVTNGLFERKTWTNLLINAGFWIVTCALIGGLTDMWN